MATKPASGTPLDTGSPLYSGLIAVYGLLEGTGTTITDSKGGNNGTTHDGSWSTDAYGPVWLTTQNNVGQPIAVTSFQVGSLTGNSWSFAFRAQTTTNVGNGVVAGDSTGQGPFVALLSNGSYLFVRSSHAGDAAFSDFTDFSSAADYVVTYDGSGNMRAYKNGSASSSNPQSVDGFQPATVSINAINNGYTTSVQNLELPGYVSYLYVWDGRVISPTEAASLAANPFQIFQSGGGGGTFSQCMSVNVMGLG